MNKTMVSQSIKKQNERLEAKLVVAVFKEDKYYVAYCPALDLSTYASARNEIPKVFAQALDIFFEETIRKGTLEKLLIKYGWTLQKTQFQPPYASVELLNKYKNYPSFKLHEERVEIPYAIAT
jgi:hypothetical protein